MCNLATSAWGTLARNSRCFQRLFLPIHPSNHHNRRSNHEVNNLQDSKVLVFTPYCVNCCVTIIANIWFIAAMLNKSTSLKKQTFCILSLWLKLLALFLKKKNPVGIQCGYVSPVETIVHIAANIKYKGWIKKALSKLCIWNHSIW